MSLAVAGVNVLNAHYSHGSNGRGAVKLAECVASSCCAGIRCEHYSSMSLRCTTVAPVV